MPPIVRNQKRHTTRQLRVSDCSSFGFKSTDVTGPQISVLSYASQSSNERPDDMHEIYFITCSTAARHGLLTGEGASNTKMLLLACFRSL
jgi:hypothetical protein